MTERAPIPEGQASFQRANEESRERMARLFATLTPAQMAIDLGGGWTVASAVAHTRDSGRGDPRRAAGPAGSVDPSPGPLAAIDLALTHGG